MKNDRQSYKEDRQTGACQKDVRVAGKTGEPDRSDPQKNHPARLTEYDDWIQHEEKKYSRLLMELKKARWFNHSVSPMGRFIRTSSHEGAAHIGSVQFGADKPSSGKYDIYRMIDEPMSTELEETKLTDDEVRQGCGFTMEQALLGYKKPAALDIDRCWERSSTQQSITFQYTLSVRRHSIVRFPIIEAIQMARSKLSESDGRNSMYAMKLWLEVGEPYSSYSEFDSTAAINFAGPEPSRRNGNWCLGKRWPQSVRPIPWDTVMVESVRIVLLRWRGVCSFSQTRRSTRSNEESHLVCGHCSKNEVGLPARQLSGGENDYAQIKLEGLEIW